MTTIKTFYHSLDEYHTEVVRFYDGSSIRYEGKGEVHVNCTNDEHMIFENIVYLTSVKDYHLNFEKA